MKIITKKYCLFYLFLLVSFTTVIGQDTMLITGKIVAGKNTPLQDVAISVEGYDIAPVITDTSGNFSISVPGRDVWLIVDPVGNYENKRIFLDGRKSLLISLATSSMKSDNDQVKINNAQVSRSDIISSYFDIDLEKNPYDDVESF